MRLKDLFKPEWWSERLYREEWNIGIVDQTAEEIVQHGFRLAPRWLPRAEGAMQADPSCLPFEDGRLLLMAEHMDYRSGRGEIWSAVVPAGSKLDSLAFYPWLAGTCHLSYPFPFVDARGRRYLTVESAEADGLFLWREDGGKWILSGSILPDLPAIDATLWRDSERWWLFCGLRNDLPNERLYLYHAEKPEGPWSPHRANPVKIDAASSRPAGPLFWAAGLLIRPAQDCSQTYGGAVVLNEVRRLDLDGFSETAIRRLEPIDSAYPHGLHTFCSAGECTLIDGKRLTRRPLQLVERPILKCKALLRSRASRRGECVFGSCLPLALANSSLGDTCRGKLLEAPQ
jgi:hypothetical protein